MAQKINPVGLRLGLTQVWDTTMQVYGKSCTTYPALLTKKRLINKILACSLVSTDKKLRVNNRFSFYHKGLQLNIKYLNKSLKAEEVLIKNLSKVTSAEFNVKLFDLLDIHLTGKLLASYIEYLFSHNTNLKAINSNLVTFLNKCVNLKKVVYLNNTIAELNLSGFKIETSGRFDNTRNQMAKSYKQDSGSLPLVCLESYVEFCDKIVFTKLGACSFQIWLFYKIKYSSNANYQKHAQ